MCDFQMALEEAILAESGFLGHRDGDAYSAHPEAHLIFSHYFALQTIRRFMEHWETFIV